MRCSSSRANEGEKSFKRKKNPVNIEESHKRKKSTCPKMPSHSPQGSATKKKPKDPPCKAIPQLGPHPSPTTGGFRGGAKEGKKEKCEIAEEGGKGRIKTKYKKKKNNDESYLDDAPSGEGVRHIRHSGERGNKQPGSGRIATKGKRFVSRPPPPT